MDKTFIGVKEIAAKMDVSEKTIYRMLNDNQFPFALKIGGQWRFRADGVENWIAGQISGEQETGRTNYRITVSEALQNGTVLFRIHGSNRDEALDELLTSLPHNAGFDPNAAKISILTRESMASSCLAGISCMTTSSDQPVSLEKSIVILAFLEAPTDFRALDGQKAQAIFLILPANAGEKVILETRLQRLLMERQFVDILLQQPGRREILDLLTDWEARFLAPRRR